MENIKAVVIELPHPEMLVESYQPGVNSNGVSGEYSQDTAAWD